MRKNGREGSIALERKRLESRERWQLEGNSPFKKCGKEELRLTNKRFSVDRIGIVCAVMLRKSLLT